MTISSNPVYMYNNSEGGLAYEDVDVGSPNESKDEPVYARAYTPPTLSLGDCPVPSLVRISQAEEHPYDLTSPMVEGFNPKKGDPVKSSTKEEESIYEVNSLDEEI